MANAKVGVSLGARESAWCKVEPKSFESMNTRASETNSWTCECSGEEEEEDRVLRILLGDGKEKARASKASIVDFPNLERIINAEPQIAQVMADISRHYGATQAVLTWRSAGFLHFKSDSHSEVSCSAVVPDSQLFNHTLTRRLPIIVGDASVIGSAQPLPSLVSKPRFYAAAPLVLQPEMYVGTLCFVDSDATRPSFSLADASFLERKAAEVVGILQGYCTHLPA
jgi:hypothetical protein